ncbi:carbohydrate ABC transporter permease [Sediminispirochaeta smaragdinae]|uniref:Binding-protein-dependent transport systems inner membrane component n=1 Tax=Sediminispirochaeta smaragdinae (strain DSM 11293 / JCM 15392 / SEBR 4228) TaxID=573413 RepID=E1RBY9_SEDSS|nr:carbohydrate ABC transporter permease [Sediminispirochaeta smaragdinae]ADK79869.1 binding-protein-dependent transport systems inner membrane component [Sediminispirochaeta smaragdinae DSM 11293]
MKKTLRIICYVLVVFICNLPLLATIATSLKTPAQISASPPLLFFKPTLANYAEVLTSPSLHFGTYLRNSFGLALLGTLFSILLALPAAYGMVRHGVGKKFLLPFVTNLRTFPLIIFAIPFYFMFQSVGLLDTVLGLAILSCLINLPLALVVLLSFFQDLPIELEEAAFVDGASTFQTMRMIILPLATTVLASVSVLSFIYAWNEFLFGLILTTKVATPVTVGATFFITSFGIRWGQTAAAITLSILPPMFIGVLSFRYLTKALLSGAIKG